MSVRERSSSVWSSATGEVGDLHVRILAATPSLPVHPLAEDDVGIDALFVLIREWIEAVLMNE